MLMVMFAVTTTYMLTVAGGFGSIAPPPAKAVVRVVAAPSISSFGASPSAVVLGSTTVLSWNADTLNYSVDDGTGTVIDVGPQTHLTVRPSATTTYTLT